MNTSGHSLSGWPQRVLAPAFPHSFSRLPLALLSCVLALSGCGSGSSSTPGASGAGAVIAVPVTRYDLANGCYALGSAVSGQYLQKLANGSYQLTASTPASALPIFFKATALGHYLLSLPGSRVLTATSTGIADAADASDSADWSVDTNSAGQFLMSTVTGARGFVVDPSSGNVTISGMPSALKMTPVSGCTAYPEITTNVDGDSFSGTLANGQVLGFADAHVHVGATDFLGGAHYGHPFDRFGVTHALADCSVSHGPDGRLDLVGNLFAGTPTATHDTQGWPTFASWPAAHSLTHESTYYRWVERAWKSGLRVLVNELVENEVLCTLNSTAKLKPQNCNEMNTVYTQIQTMHDLQDYIDAQSGGPGKGWFRLVTTPADARQVIAQGKLAVVLGVEISHILDCSVKVLPGGIEQDGCTQASIDTELDSLKKAGVRQMFPVHEFDNALGGNGIFNPLILNIGNFVDTGKFWSTYDCPDTPYFYPAGAVLTTVPGVFDGSDPLTTLLKSALNGTLPVYNSTKAQCNARRMTTLGRYAISHMMDRGIVIDLDHLELNMKSDVIDLAKTRKSADGTQMGYPLTSTHGGFGGITMDQAKDIFRLGGLIYGYKGNGKDYAAAYQQAKNTYVASGATGKFAFGYGADTNGLGEQADPRPAGSTPVSYPFTLFHGNDWDPALFGSVKALTFQQQVSGERRYNTDKDGMAHYGLVADWVEEVRIEGGKDALNALFGSAEVYLRMWERAQSFQSQ